VDLSPSARTRAGEEESNQEEKRRRRNGGRVSVDLCLQFGCPFTVCVALDSHSQVPIAASVSTLGIADSHNLERIFLQF